MVVLLPITGSIPALSIVMALATLLVLPPLELPEPELPPPQELNVNNNTLKLKIFFSILIAPMNESWIN